ncbi:MAG TPA: NADH:ubiquinone reductase (Na(+)-transporting) subunit B [Flavobacteriales bacterium]|nr:NADH:ubiquinone reductase (Na(+)-transporting) subunit B [Flavobacteriales bacterium]
MKFLENILEKAKPHFEEGGKLKKLFPVYDAFATFLFVPDHVTHKGTHIRDGIDLKRTMITVVLALVPCLLFGIWNTGHQHFLALGQFTGLEDGFWDKVVFGTIKVLPIVMVSYMVGLGVEFIGVTIKKEQVNEGYLVSGMLIPLVMPVDIPLWMVGVATVFAVVIGKEVFGGTGMNILNPALTARAFLFFAYPTKMSGDVVWVNTSLEKGEVVADGYSGATPLAQAIDNGDRITSVTGEPLSMMDMFFGFMPGSIGETSALACLIGAFILLFSGIGSWRIMLSVFVGGYLMAWIFNTFAVNPFMEVPPLTQLVMGGFIFGAVYMATDPVTAAQTNKGKYIYGFFIGFLAIMIRVFNPAYPEGMMLAILFMNVMAPLIDHYVVGANINRRLKRLKAA